MKKAKYNGVSNLRIHLAYSFYKKQSNLCVCVCGFDVFWCADAASEAAEAVWREKAQKELEDWHVHQNEQMEKNKANNRYFHSNIQALLSCMYLLVKIRMQTVVNHQSIWEKTCDWEHLIKWFAKL